jgi:hypothetical protein
MIVKRLLSALPHKLMALCCRTLSFMIRPRKPVQSVDFGVEDMNSAVDGWQAVNPVMVYYVARRAAMSSIGRQRPCMKRAI